MINYEAVAMEIKHSKEACAEMDRDSFICLMCMKLEEWCKANQDDVVNMADQIAQLVKMVNTSEGKY